jgi:hypothetical protein
MIRRRRSVSRALLKVRLLDARIYISSQILAIGICFSMTDVFRSEILAVVMQQIMDEPVLPVLFLRTVSQSNDFLTTAYIS